MDKERFEQNSTDKAKETRWYHNQKTEYYIYQSKDHEEIYTNRSVDCTDIESSFRVKDLEAACTIPLCSSVQNCSRPIGNTIDKLYRNSSNLTSPKAESYCNVEYKYSALVNDNHSPSPLKLCASITEVEHSQSVDSYIGLMLEYEFIRLMTFKEVITPVSNLRLAESGFFHTSYTTKCFSCGVTYGEWKHCNKVNDVHRMISPKCK